MKRWAAGAAGTVAAATALALAWTGTADSPTGTAGVVVRDASTPLELVDADPAEAALAVSRRLFVSSPAVIVSADDKDSRRRAIDAASELAVPVLVDGPAVPVEIARLGARTVLTVGAVTDLRGARPLRPTDAPEALGTTGERESTTVVMTRSLADDAVAVSNARAAGADVVEVEDGDPRRSADVATAIWERRSAPVVALGMPRDFAYTLAVVRDDVEQPSGGYLALADRHYVALYGHPGAPSLGLLGEQGAQESIERVTDLADQYAAVADTEFVPTFEIIATVAAGGAGADGNYSIEAPLDRLRPLVDAAAEAGVSVLLDLQPGRTDFLTQAKQYEELLEQPHVGLALDPEWRLGRDEVHLEQIGSVSAAEINRTSNWLAALTRERSLPQKLFVVHQFTSSMITQREDLDTSHAELATVIHVDGSGSPGDKQATWAALHRDPPRGLAGWGWKNFLDEDAPMLTVPQTWADVTPKPDLISYQ